MNIEMDFDHPSLGLIEDTHIRCIEFNFNFYRKHGRIVYGLFLDEESFATRPPLHEIAFDIESTSGTRPSFDQLVGMNLQAYGLLTQSVYEFALSQPEFASGTLIM
jgi:hypothetical protein